MKLMLNCHQCSMDLLESGIKLGSEEFEAKHWFEHVYENDQGFYVTTCSKGHQIACGLSNRNFEILFDRATCALLDGYYREAIATYASSLERFFEFYVRVACRSQGLPSEKIVAFWKSIGNRSERQLGSFYLAYLLQNKAEFSGTKQKMEELRNDVVHKGLFANREDAHRYGEYVYNILWDVLKTMQSGMSQALDDELSQAYLDEVNRGRERTGYQGNIGGIGLSTLVQSHATKAADFSEAVADFERRNPWNIGGYDTRLGTLARQAGLSLRDYLREFASGKYASAFNAPSQLSELEDGEASG
jgi:hypothetical protein